MPDRHELLPMMALCVLLAGAWVGHACIWTYALNNLYGRPISKRFLKLFRLFVGVVIAGAPLLFPLLLLSAYDFPGPDDGPTQGSRLWGPAIIGYTTFCALFGLVVFPVITVRRLLRPQPKALLAETPRTLDLWPEYGHKLVGDGRMPWATRLPFTCVFKVDFTEITLAVPGLPPEWDGLTVLHLSDFHFHGTPSEVYFRRVIDEVTRQPPPDLVVLAGDYLDTDEHRRWIPELLRPLKWTEHGLAVLGNHDLPYHPDKTRAELAALGYTVLGNRWEELTIRGVPCVVVGHEGPWFYPPPDLSAAPADRFRLCVSHSPDNFYWGVANRVNLMFCGHVHGGQIRVPVVGSIFVPSIYSRRFDMGVFEEGGMVMVAGRGLSGKEPLRFRCHPQVIRLTLRPGPSVPSPPGFAGGEGEG